MTERQGSKPITHATAAMALKQRLASLSPEKLAALQKQLQQQERSSREPVRALPNEAVFPLSFHQQRLWFIEQFQPGTPLYNVTRAIRMRGSLNRGALHSALQSLVHRHQALRTTFHMLDGEPVQRINESPELQLPVVNLRAASRAIENVESLLQQRLTDEGRRTFDLSTDLLLRAVLYQVADDEHVLQVTIHHLNCDGSSLQLLFNELSVLYRGFCSGQAAELSPLQLRYVDFARWQREPRQRELFAERVQWWKRQLADAPPVLELATDRMRPQIASGAGAIQPLEIPSDLLSQLQDFGQKEGATLYMTLLAGFFILLHRYTGMEDFLVGSATAGRNRPEVHGIVGFFVDTVVLRADLSGQPTARQVLQKVRRTVIDAVEHGDVPFERVVDSLNLPKDLSRHPLFQIMFNAPPQYSLSLHDLSVTPVNVDLHVSRFDLEMTYSDGANRTTGMTWNTDLFDPETIRRMLGHYCVVLKAMTVTPDQTVGQLPLLTEPERQQLLIEWNNTAVEYPRDKCVHELFQEQVERTPDVIAVVFQDQDVTYRELNERANQVAHYLRSLEVGPETLVGLCLERSVDLVVAILGILKAGGAYVPLDAEYPRSRLEFMLRDARIGLLVTQQGLRDRLSIDGCSVVCLDSDAPRLQEFSKSNPALQSRADNLAYVMYTSGSTGQPKGAEIPHRAISRLLFGADYAQFDSSLRIAQLAPISFDASTLEIWGPLLHGGCCLLFPDGIPDFVELEQAISRQRVRTLWLTASLFNAVIDEHPQALQGIEQLLIGGEALSVPHVRRALSLLGPTTQLINGYGPTECTTFSCCYPIPPTGSAEIVSVPIGRPIANAQAYILDRHRQAVPIGIPGELYIGGDGLARGYLNRPELTAEKFVPNPFSDDPASRLYRTGDLCRWRADGNLEFLGRLDDQVKLRGFRIELGEIETVLNEHPSVAQSVVAMREDRPGDKRLVGYCVPARHATWNVTELTRHLRTKLPDYMVPSTFVVLPALPLTSSGKVNRRALPAPDESRPELETAYTGPRSPLEEHLASIWCEVLGLERVGIHDNFFALGGHSLLATRVNVRIAAAFQVQLPLRRLFEAPTIAELAAAIEALRGGGLSSCGTALRRIDREQRDWLPLSFAQQRLWFLEQLEGELTAYNMPFAWRLRGSLDTEALRRALEAIVRRHEALRTTFAMIEEEPVQVIGTIPRFELPVEDLSSFDSEHREAEIVRRSRLEAERPFDLTRDLMLRASLLRLAADEQVLLLTMHHIASDGWSLRVLWRELGHLYDAYCHESDPDLPDLPVQYADYAVWQRQELQGERLPRLLQYWRRQLDGVCALELPTDRPRPPVPTYQGARHDFTLRLELVDQLQALSQREGVTLHMTLLAAFQALLARYSGQDDIAVGMPIAGRQHAELEQLIGFFVNTLVLRTDLSGEPTFRELLSRVRETSLSAYDHQDLPFEKLVEELQPQRHLSRSPLVQVLFQVLNFSDKDLALRDIEILRLPPSSGRVRFDLEMQLWQQPQKLRGAVVYSTDLFDPATIERMVGHFVTLLEGIVANPNQRLSELPLLTEAERHQILVEWNDTAREYPRDKCVHELFQEQAQRTPEAIAVVYQDQQLTYRQLNERSNQLAHYLRSLGVGPESLVGLCLERSLEMIVGLLGILKAGAAYLPLDPETPRQRLNFMLVDGGVRLTLSQTSLRDRLAQTRVRLLCLDEETNLIASQSQANLASSTSAENLAYVMYTSGSTGQPKGAAIPHRAINRLLFGVDYARFDSSLRVAQLAPISFDASTLEIWGPLLHGGCCLLFPDGVPDFAELEGGLARHRVQTLWLTASLFNAVMDERPQALWGIEQLLVGGEALSVPHVRRALDSLSPKTQLINGYGPTECTTFTCCYRIPRTLPAEVTSVPIGRPIANAQVYVLDRHGQPVPVGIPGELYIGGDGLARGYLNRPELTAERFVCSPFEVGNRLYRTGDRVRWMADGSLEFLGRLDDQVKLRGFRVELGEIETVLREHSSVAQCVVMLREDRPGDKRLVSYYVPLDGHAPSHVELSRYVGEKLPKYMLPSAFVMLDSLPLTANGKVDRRGLPAPDESRPELETAYTGPRSPLEEHLASIWCDVLGLETIGIHDNFFELGGHSLLATQVVARASAMLQVNLPLRRLFEFPTVAQITAEISALRSGEQSSPGRKLARIDRQRIDPLPLSFAQQRLWFLEQLEGKLAVYNMPFAWRLRGRLCAQALRQALETIFQRHESLRTTFRLQDGQPWQVVQPPSGFDLPLVDLVGLPPDQQEAELTARGRVEASRPFDLSADVMLRAALLRLADEEHVLLLKLHHIAADGWSIRVLWQELEAAYAAALEHTGAALPELPIQYADYAVWQREELQGQQQERLLAYWRKQLEGMTALELPTDRPRPPQSSYQGARHSFEVPRELVESLRKLSWSEGVTLHMTLLAAFQALLARYSGQDDIAVGMPIAGRQHAELDQLIGFFVNTLVLRTDLSGEPTFRELLGRVRATSLGAYDHQDLPFEKLVEELRPERHLSRSPLFQVLFQLLEFPGGDLALRGLEVRRLPNLCQQAPFDLEMHLRMQPEGMVQGTVVYSTELFEADTIQRLAGHYLTLLGGIVAEPDRRIGELPLLTKAERQQLLVEWNDTAREYPRDKCVHELFQEQAQRTPEAIAVVYQDQQLTYRQLNERSNQLAHYLRSLGVGPESLVGLCLERSLEMIVGLLGILKAGAAYLPLDLGYPQSRLAFMLADGGASVLCTQHRLRGKIPKPDTRVVCLDDPAEQISGPHDNPANNAAPDNLAYLIYTSGSTGQPKGVMVSHGALSNHCFAVAERYGLCPDDRVLQFASLSFDVAAEELFPSWLAGATVVLCDERTVDAGPAFIRFLAENKLTVVNLPTSFWQALVSSAVSSQLGCPASLRLAVAGTESVLAAQLLTWREWSGERVRWVNAFGTTEATITSTIYEAASSGRLQTSQVPIGRPIANVQVYVLDRHRQLVPVGVPGELYIGGAGLAREYRNLPELSRQKFLANPFSAAPDHRIYQTGDLVRWLPEGNLVFLGRTDGQVKVRGFRIELEEIEAALRQHSGVRQAVATVTEAASGDKRLAAYVVPNKVGGTVELWPCVGDFQVFDEVMHHAMTHDEYRNRAYREAIKQLVRDKIVVDIGTGKDVIWGRCCAEAGARRIYSIESQAEACKQARELVKSLGLEERIIVLYGDSRQLTLPEPADVCVSQLIGNIGSSEGVIPILNDARRFLRKGGVMIPARCATRIAAVSLPDEVAREPAFSELSSYYVRQVFDKVGRSFDLRVAVKNFATSQIISDHGVFEDLDFCGPLPAEYEREVILTINKAGRLHGFLLWLNLHVADGQVLDTLRQASSWLPVYFPAFDAGVDVSPDDLISARCSAVLSEDKRNPDFRICGKLLRRGDADLEFEHVSPLYGTRFKSNSFYSALFVDGGPKVRQKMAPDLSVGSLREHLEKRLPIYMVPSAIVILDSLPTTSSGKVDRRALRITDVERSQMVADYAVPRDAVEEQLAAIWKEVLGLERIGVHDNFFALGGHSLLAVRLLAAIERTLHVRLPLAECFRHPTIAKLAGAVRQPCIERTRPVIDVLREGGNEPPLLVAPSFFGEIHEWQKVAEMFSPRRPIYALRVAGGEPYWSRCDTLQDVARGFVDAIVAASLKGPFHLTGFSFGGVLAFEVASQLVARGHPVGAITVVDTGMHQGTRGLWTRIVRDVPSMILNFPRWFLMDIVRAAPRQVVARTRRKLRSLLLRLCHWVMLSTLRMGETHQPANHLSESMFDAGRLPSLYQQRMEVSLRFLRHYRPNPYRGRLVLLNTRVRPLVHRGDRDRGWRQWVDGRIDVRTMPGNHDTVFSEPYVHSLVAALEEVMVEADGLWNTQKKTY